MMRNGLFRNKLLKTATVLGLIVNLIASPATAANLVSLKGIPIPKPANLANYVADENAAVRLGKAFFWDMQLGSDGATACASCHFHAGTDSRTANTLNPGSNGSFGSGKSANKAMTRADFPFVRFTDPEDRTTTRTVVTDDVVGAQGVNKNAFKSIRSGNPEDRGQFSKSSTFSSHGRNVRQVTGRNSPTVINAVFNYANFWDGRANHFFNGVNPFGYEDTSARIHKNVNGTLTELDLSLLANRLDNASLASQAVGPPLSDVEMSWAGRSFPELGRKMLSLRPLAKQTVATNDSRLGFMVHASGKGLNATYSDMIKAAFRPEFWNNTNQTISSGNGSYSQMESNFAFFFGMAVMLYEATLVSDDSPFDRFMDGDSTALTQRQQRGLNIFQSGAAACTACHIGTEFTAVSITNTKNPAEPSVIELMPMADNNLANYDIGFYNIGVTPTAEDLGRGANDPFGLPLSFSKQFLNSGSMPFSADFIATPGCLNTPLADPPRICPPTNAPPNPRAAVNGAFKTPGLRNVELTGPYFHNGSALTLKEVIDFYVRGGNFHDDNIADLDPFVDGIPSLRNNEADQAALIDFLIALTDERVRWERAPFDHPQLFIPNGHQAKVSGDPRRVKVLEDKMIELPAVGSSGRTQAQGPLKPFLDATGNPNFHFID
jgi:cytochrome c peroxidase